MNTKAMRIIGIVIAGIGFLLALGAATIDLFTGGGMVGDSQIGAFFISVTVLLFGLLLVLLSNNLHLKERIRAIEGLHDNIKAEPEGVLLKGQKLSFLFKRFNILGLIITLAGLAIMLLLTLKDYEPLLSFDIGSLQMLAIFAGTAISMAGLGIMTLDTTVLSNSLSPMVLQLEPLLATEKETTPGKPIPVKRVLKKPRPEPTPDLVEPMVTVEVVAEGTEDVSVAETVTAQPEEVTAEEAPPQEEPYIEEPPASEPIEAPATEIPLVEGKDQGLEGDAEEMADEGFPEAEEEISIEAEEEAAYDTPETEVLSTVEEPTGPEGTAEAYECPNCNGQVGETDLTCPHCGVRFDADEEVVEETPEGPEVPTEEEGPVEASPTPSEMPQPPSIEEDEISGPPGPTDTIVVDEPLPEGEPEAPVEEEASTEEDVPTEEAEKVEAAGSNILKSILNEISKLDTEPEEAPVEVDEAAEVPVTCPKCGRKLKPRWKSCPYCGLEFR